VSTSAPTPHDSPDPDDELLTIADLSAYGLTPADVRRPAPWATEYVALDGGPAWRAEDLAELLHGTDDEEGCT
jgi:hypothetical protein